MWHRIRAITNPETESPTLRPFTLDQVKTHLRVDDANSDSYINEILIPAAINLIEGPRGYGFPVMERQWEMTFDSFPWQIQLPIPEITSVDSIKYVDTDGDEQTLAATEYQVDTTGDVTRIEPAYSKTWPSTRDVLAAVKVRFTAGYSTAADVPGDLKAGMLLVIGHLYENREEVIVGSLTAAQLPMGAQTIFEKYRVGRFG